MAIHSSALPPSLVAELRDLQRRIEALERKPKLGSVNERLPVGSYQSSYLEGSVGTDFTHILGAINTTGLNRPVLQVAIPFFIPILNGTVQDVSMRVWLADPFSGRTTEKVTLDSSHYTGSTRTLVFTWEHPQAIGFDDDSVYKTIRIDYQLLKTTTHNGERVTVAMGMPTWAVGVGRDVYAGDLSNGLPLIDELPALG